jgi:hypothetical protein
MNLENVKTIVIASDGKLHEASLEAREQSMLEAVDAAIRANPNFETELPDAILEHVESMRGIKETDDGRLYLRYRTSKNPVPLEFWGCLAKNPRVDWASGFVHVTEEDLENMFARNAQTSQDSSQTIANPEPMKTPRLEYQPPVLDVLKPN